MRILVVENLRFPEEGSSAQGKSGSKPRPKGVADGKRVNIPVLPQDDKDRWGDAEGQASPPLDVRVQGCRKAPQANPRSRVSET